MADVHERMEQLTVSVAAVFDGERFLGLVNLDDIREAMQIAAFQRASGWQPEDRYAA